MYKLFIVFVFFFANLSAQDSANIKKVLHFQEELNKEFASEDTSPMVSKDFEGFKGIDFFEIDTSFCVSAKFVRTPYEAPFIMKTSTNSEPIYVKYAEAIFVVEGKEYVLNIYQNQVLKTRPELEDYLFLPFTDITNGKTTYEGGRYVDLRIPEGNSIVIDFNMAYNPYCAYNSRYSCPIPTKENHLEIAITAGVKKYKKRQENK